MVNVIKLLSMKWQKSRFPPKQISGKIIPKAIKIRNSHLKLIYQDDI